MARLRRLRDLPGLTAGGSEGKAVALQAAIDAVAAEHVTTDEGAGACVLS